MGTRAVALEVLPMPSELENCGLDRCVWFPLWRGGITELAESMLEARWLLAFRGGAWEGLWRPPGGISSWTWKSGNLSTWRRFKLMLKNWWQHSSQDRLLILYYLTRISWNTTTILREPVVIILQASNSDSLATALVWNWFVHDPRPSGATSPWSMVPTASHQNQECYSAMTNVPSS